MKFSTADSFKAKKKLEISGATYSYYDLNAIAAQIGLKLSQLPITLRIILENQARFEDGKVVKEKDIRALAEWLKNCKSDHEISYFPSRVLMQDFTGVPAVVDLAAMRDAMIAIGGDPQKINPLIPVDLVIDHSVQVDTYASANAFDENVKQEVRRNKERYTFLKWGQSAFNNFRVVPTGTGICHQVNLEYLAKVVWHREINGETFIYPDTLVGTDSHTTMINGLAVLGWGVGGIEAEAAMLGQPISMVIPEVIGVELFGKMREGVTATDLVLTVTNLLRTKGVVNKFVEFYGEGLVHLPLADRATVGNMAPEYGATCGFFPIDEETLKYLKLSGRSQNQIELVEKYAKIQGLWRDDHGEMKFTDTVRLDLSSIEPSMAGPKRPQDKVPLSSVNDNFAKELPKLNKNAANTGKEFTVNSGKYSIKNGDVVIAAITSCTNTSNPSVMIGAGLVARKALALGLQVKPWVKTSLAPGSKVVTEYLVKAGLQKDLDALGFNLVGYGCTTCIGNSGPLLEEIEKVVAENNLVVAAVLSGNRNFEGRVHPLVRANYLASPMLCVAYALAGSMNIDLTKEPLGIGANGKEVYLKDIWPTNMEIADYVAKSVDSKMFIEKYSDVFKGDAKWQELPVSQGITYDWDDSSTYIKLPPYFENMGDDQALKDIKSARVLAIFGDSITTDHISPAGSISKISPAAKYLNAHNIQASDFNSYGARRGNHEVMMRGTFANIRIKNELTPEVEGGYTRHNGKGEPVSIYDAAMLYLAEGVPTIIIAGKEYGTGSSRDWAAKGPKLQGVKAVIAESFERIHRSNLVGMGIVPLVFTGGMTRADLKLKGDESFDIIGLENMTPRKKVKCIVTRSDGSKQEFSLESRVDTEVEVDYINNGGILQFVLKSINN
ncbi:MAG: aconitate hydratase [Candidatus Midichloriaceae bacterium]|jgi:aconitate hydratase|nr:aconitate hydratase [Candidatus Midichloriaceae bacterium]